MQIEVLVIYREYLQTGVCDGAFAVAFTARMRTSLTPSKQGHFYNSCVLALWHIAMKCTLPIGGIEECKPYLRFF